MSDAYRTSPHQCPSCKSSALREYNHSLVCDECNGMLIAADELAASIHELDGGNEPFTIYGEEPSKKPCPKCGGAMSKCELSIGWMKLPETFLHCARDGIWCPQEAMAGAFARASRHTRGSVGVGRTYGGVTALAAPGASGGLAGAIGSIGAAFGSGGAATDGLAIGNWADSRPRVHTLFVSAFKDRTLGCPSCKEAKLAFHGDRWDCDACGGSFVEDAALSAMVMEMTLQPWQPPAVKGAAGDRHCPVCEAPMIVEVLEAVTTDRCAAHGVWFDHAELQTALEHATTPSSESWVRKLFHRHGKSLS